MPLKVLTFGDGGNGQQLSAWVDEFVYAMGGQYNLDDVAVGKAELIVLALSCLPSEWPIGEGTSRKGRGSGRELWSHARIDYMRFNGGSALERIDEIAETLVKALKQVPTVKLAPGDLEKFSAAVAFAVQDLRMRPERHPR